MPGARLPGAHIWLDSRRHRATAEIRLAGSSDSGAREHRFPGSRVRRRCWGG